eukprot:gene6202-10208_t
MSMKRKRSLTENYMDYDKNKLKVTEDMIEELRKLNLAQIKYEKIDLNKPPKTMQKTISEKEENVSQKLLNMYKSNYQFTKSLSPNKNMQLILYQEPKDIILPTPCIQPKKYEQITLTEPSDEEMMELE